MGSPQLSRILSSSPIRLCLLQSAVVTGLGTDFAKLQLKKTPPRIQLPFLGVWFIHMTSIFFVALCIVHVVADLWIEQCSYPLCVFPRNSYLAYSRMRVCKWRLIQRYGGEMN